MGGSKQTQTSSATPFKAAKPLLNAQASAATDYLSDPNNTAGAQQSADYYKSVVGGDYLNAGNPHTQGVLDAIKANVMPSVNGTFANAGLANSTLHQGMLAKGLSQGYAQPLFQNYENERSRQDGAAAALPGAEFAASGAGAASNTLPISSSFAPYASQTQTSQTKQPLWQQIAGGAMAGAGLLAAPITGGTSLSMLGAANGLMGNPAGMDVGMAPSGWGANTYVNGSPLKAPWQLY